MVENLTVFEIRRALAELPDDDWEWSDRRTDAEGYVYIPQGSYLGETLIMLGDTYENCERDCDFITNSKKYIRFLLDCIEDLDDKVNFLESRLSS